MLLKSIMKSVKFCVGKIPTDLKLKLSRNPYLMSWYSKALNSSGLFYGEPCPKEMQNRYEKILLVQEKNLSSLKSVKEAKVLIVVICDDNTVDRVHYSLKAVERLNVSRIEVVLCAKNKSLLIKAKNVASKLDLSFEYELFCGSSLSELFILHPQLKNIPGLFINSGDKTHSKAFQAFSLLIDDSESYSEFVYSDVDLFDDETSRFQPYFKSAWNPELQLSTEYIDTGLWSRTAHKVDLCLTDASPISQWIIRRYLSDFSFTVSHLPYTLISAFQHGCHSIKTNTLPLISATVSINENNQVRKVKWPHDNPLVSLIIPTKNAKELVETCINSILELTTYENFEILLVDNNSDDEASLKLFEQLSIHPKVTLLKYPYSFNYSAINNFAVSKAKGDIIGLINNDIEVISPEWLDYMVGHAVRDDIGCVGAKLLYPDNKIQHAGVVLGYGGGAGHAHKYYPFQHSGYMNRLCATQNFSAVTAACLIVEKTIYQDVSGLNEEHLKVAFNDVDFCLKVNQLGCRNVYSAESELYHHESVSRGIEDTPEKQRRFQKELSYLQSHWSEYIQNDPAYNENLSLLRENFAFKE